MLIDCWSGRVEGISIRIGPLLVGLVVLSTYANAICVRADGRWVAVLSDGSSGTIVIDQDSMCQVSGSMYFPRQQGSRDGRS